MTITDTKSIIKTKATISSKILIDAHAWLIKSEHADINGYPEIMNKQSFVNSFILFCKKIAQKKGLKEIPDQVWLNIIEEPDIHSTDSRYSIVIENEERLQDLPRTYSIIMVYKPTNEAESVSLISDDEIVWSADNQINTNHSNRTLYYLGFISLITKKTPDFDKEPEPENELNITDFLSEISGVPPQELIKIPTLPEKQKEEEKQQETVGNTQKSYDNEYHNMEKTELEDDLKTSFIEEESDMNIEENYENLQELL